MTDRKPSASGGHLTGGVLHPQTEEAPCHGDGPSYRGCCDSLVCISVFQLLNYISMAIHIIWFSVLIFCFSVNVAVCDAVRLEFFFVCGSLDRLYTGRCVLHSLCICNFPLCYINPVPSHSSIPEL